MVEILSLNPQLLYGAAGFLGGAGRGLITFAVKKKKDKKIKFDVHAFIDTSWQSAATGVAFSFGIPVGYAMLGVTALAGAGIDSFANKFGIKVLPFLKKQAQKVDKKNK